MFLSSTAILLLKYKRSRQNTKLETASGSWPLEPTALSISKRHFTARWLRSRRIDAFRRRSFPCFQFFVRPTPSFLSISHKGQSKSLPVSAREPRRQSSRNFQATRRPRVTQYHRWRLDNLIEPPRSWPPIYFSFLFFLLLLSLISLSPSLSLSPFLVRSCAILPPVL